MVEPIEQAGPESIRIVMDQAWRDHHHARDQTWKALQMEALLAAGLVGVDVQIKDPVVTIAAGVLVIVAALFGVCISLHHRKLEIRKITHVFNCEQLLGLHRPDLICGVSVPSPITIGDAFRFWKMNTALFILRMHCAVIVFAALFIFSRWPR
ncbi:MAG: hypothetical protein ACYS76_08020 [Planctomycetota bacterium]